MSGITDKKLLVYTDKQTICKKSKVYELTNHINSLNNNIWKMKKKKQQKTNVMFIVKMATLLLRAWLPGLGFKTQNPWLDF